MSSCYKNKMNTNTHSEKHADQPSNQEGFWFTVKAYGGEHNVQSRQYQDLLESVDIFKAKISSQKYHKVKLCLHQQDKILVLCDQAVQPEKSPNNDC